MTHKALFAAIIIAAAVALAGLLVAAAHPLLYSPVNETPETEFHLNPDVLTAGEVNSTSDVYPIMQDLLDSPGDIVLNIRINDIESAQAALAEYQKTYGTLDHLVIRLDMNQSEIDTFARSAEVQDQIFQQLMNESATLDALQQLEIQYQSSDDPGMVTSVRYQGAELRDRLHELYNRYSVENATVMSISTKHGLDTTNYEKSSEEFQKIIKEADALGEMPEPVRAARAFNSSTAFLTLAIYPREAVYRDTILVLGYLNAPDNNTTITLELDDAPLMNITADETGEYKGSFVVERIPAGSHNLTAWAANLSSPAVQLQVIPVNSTTTLSARPSPGKTAADCNGTIIANYPVRYAPFTITEKGQVLINGTTDGMGAFTATVPLPPGIHILTARFSSPAYPVNPSFSDPVTVTIPPLPSVPTGKKNTLWDTIIAGIIIAGVPAAAAAGALWYLRRKKLPAGPVADDRGAGTIPGFSAETPEIRTPPEPERFDRAILSALLRETVSTRFRKLIRSDGLSEAAHQIYLAIAGRIALRHHIDKYRALTPRELAKTCAGEHFFTSLHAFIAAYEKIRFGGGTGNQEQSEFETSLKTIDRETRGDHH